MKDKYGRPTWQEPAKKPAKRNKITLVDNKLMDCLTTLIGVRSRAALASGSVSFYSHRQQNRREAI